MGREEFVLKYLKENKYCDILNNDFMVKIINEFNLPCATYFYGAPKCTTVGRLLSRMFKKGLIDRGISGLVNAHPGFPKWIYVYSTKEATND